MIKTCHVTKTLPDKDLTNLMCDINAKIGHTNTVYELVMRIQGLGVINKNGDIFENMCALNNMSIGADYSPKKESTKEVECH
jgi:hypothetical protein